MLPNKWLLSDAPTLRSGAPQSQALCLDMNRDQHLTNVLLVGCHFARNLAYYRAGEDYRTLNKKNEFWCSVTVNCFDVAVVEWCKLFVPSRNNKHYWRKVVSDTEKFERGLLSTLMQPASLDGFSKYSRTMQNYRDKFVAHLDSEYIAQRPGVDDAWRSIQHYYRYVLNEESSQNAFSGFSPDIVDFHDRKHAEAKEEYLRRTT